MGCFSGLWERVKKMAKFSKMMGSNIWQALFAEAMGTMLLVYVGCGSALPIHGPPNPVAISLVFGLTVATLVQGIGHVSGCHINPAVTAAMAVTGKMPFLRAALYVVAQCIGAIAGSACLEWLTPEQFRGTLGATTVSEHVTPSQALGIEFFSTFILLFFIFAVTDERKTDILGSPALAIGFVVTAQALAFGSYAGCSMNPARSLGPAVLIGDFRLHWVYWVGPIFGAIVAGFVYEKFFRAELYAERANDEIFETKKYHFQKSPSSLVNDIEKELIVETDK
ncbi:aquaporin AQPAe.a-like isoform X2 [Artemia franciscana]|uniref:Aquaporin n=1 Tax=Artemia franciscana TaxID=6661 RepID=A0AA88LAY3_ARTSF|nr:hypothetical protein QYM36_002120 [Artemia franciscana]